MDYRLDIRLKLDRNQKETRDYRGTSDQRIKREGLDSRY